MTPTLSICIPTLNRPDWLVDSLNSIFCQPLHLEKLEICISNNCSDVDYSAVEALLALHAGNCRIHYVRQVKRLSLDENHHYAKLMATSEYIFYLGDDDFFLRDELGNLLELISQNKPDLAIFNGYLVNSSNTYIGYEFALVPGEYGTIDEAFSDLKDKGHFGAILVRQELLQDSDFERLYNTDHANGCFWLSLFRQHESGGEIKIIVPDFPCVGHRSGRKAYNHIDVYYNSIPFWLEVHQQLLQTSRLRYLFDEFAAEHARKIATPRFLLGLRSMGYDLREIQRVDSVFYERYRPRIWLAQHLASMFFYRWFRGLYRQLLRVFIRMFNSSSSDATNHSVEIAYKLSSLTGSSA
jgi:abequosyltransferase